MLTQFVLYGQHQYLYSYKMCNIFLLIGLLFTSVSCTLIKSLPEAKCPSREATVNVSLDDFGGFWHVLASSPITNDVGECLQFNVSSSKSNPRSAKFRSISYRTNRTMAWEVEFESRTDILSTWSTFNGKIHHGPHIHRVLSMNSKCCTAMVVCYYEKKSNLPRQFAMIWSRYLDIDEEILNSLKEEVQQYTLFVDLKNINHVDCEEKFNDTNSEVTINRPKSPLNQCFTLVE